MLIVDNMLSEDLIKRLRAFTRTGASHRTNLTSWGVGLVGWSGAIEIFDLSPDLIAVCKDELRKRIDMKYHDNMWIGSIHLGSRMSYIPWHSDDDYLISITCYLHEKWDKNHAGYFLYEEDASIKAIPPYYNIGLIYNTPLAHSVALSSISAPIRESLQIFICKPHDG